MREIQLVYQNGTLVAAMFDETFHEVAKRPLQRAHEQARSFGWHFDHAKRGEFQYQPAFIETWKSPENDEDRLKLRLMEFDYTYEMSDDIRVWERGRAQEDEINRLVTSLGWLGTTMLAEYYSSHQI